MSRLYTAAFDSVAVTAQQDFFELTAPATTGFMVHEVRIGQSSSTTSAELLIRLRRGTSTTTSGSGGSTATPVALHANDPAANVVVEINNTTKMAVGSGALSLILVDTFNVLNGWIYLPTPETRPAMAPSQRFTVELGTTPGSSTTISGTIIFEELV
jgi:hypothetical protein